MLELLTAKVNGADDRLVRRRRLIERLRWKGITCCGASFGLRMGLITLSDDEDESEGPHEPETNSRQTLPENGSTPFASAMNLAAALEAERIFRAVQGPSGSFDYSSGRSTPDTSGAHGEADRVTPSRVSLMRLLEETDGHDREMQNAGKGSEDSLCCVCMGKKKGAAFIPCGHTFCRGCSRDLWLNRGLCPLCNRSIHEILDIF